MEKIDLNGMIQKKHTRRVHGILYFRRQRNHQSRCEHLDENVELFFYMLHE